MKQEGCLVIYDISGFTGFLQHSELEHAQETLTALLNLLVDQIQSPLEVIDLEGDAVFSYAPQVSIEQGQTVAAMIENAYVAFREALDMMVLNTTCTCTACRLLPTLDLKQFIHYGSFMSQEVAGHLRLVGHHVNLIHRLLKNSVSEATEYGAYAAYTQSAADALRLGEVVRGLKTHREKYADVGDVDLHVMDMHQVWERNRGGVRMQVQPEEAMVELEAEFPLDVEELWGYISHPHYRSLLHRSDGQHIDPLPGGEVGPGGVYVCAHGREMDHHLILDWQPPVTYTVQLTLPVPGTVGRITYLLQPSDSGARLRMLLGQPQGPVIPRLLASLLGQLRVPGFFREGLEALSQAIDREIETAE